ncbi:flagellar motor protein MotB [Rhodospirillum centenum]|uniref:Chemotaxis MotB protein n=1 Tax=Rhodospirillum centenum (strain ATCC 51521 / SW) TaxID=414684 RepID=B6IMU9_RHOCS|nr:flagellar motor protein MotB [Rhodospirillum centenum]ACI98765.1 chemotaxis MotB protein [Rhodospirillum centenum SW]
MAGGGGQNLAPIIIKKIKKGGEGHHGGAWKVAYADFVTAMMAFFLLLWLLNVTTSEQKQGIADYFSPASPSKQESGAGGVLGGQTITVPGAKINQSSPPQLTVPVPSMPASANSEEQVEDFDSSTKGRPDGTQDKVGQGEAGDSGGPGDSRLDALEKAGEIRQADKNRDGKIDEKELKEALAKLEQEQFQRTAQELRQAIQQVPELRELSQNLVIDNTPEGLRIQLVDQEGYSMFPSGSANMLPQTAQLMALVAQAVGKLPNHLSVSGHTDSTPFAAGSSRSNWDLSTERANASVRALLAAGVPENRIDQVTGRADRDHLFPDDPRSPRNRRVSIVLLREQELAGGAAPAGAAPAQPAGPTPRR